MPFFISTMEHQPRLGKLTRTTAISFSFVIGLNLGWIKMATTLIRVALSTNVSNPARINT